MKITFLQIHRTLFTGIFQYVTIIDTLHFHPFYFLSFIANFFSSHIPTSGEEWQLLARPVTHREFTEMAYLRPDFFLLGLKVLCDP